MKRGDSPRVREAKQVLGKVNKTLREKWRLVKDLQEEREFGYARRILEGVLEDRTLGEKDFENRANPRSPITRNLLIQQHAICTYKDQDSPAAQRLDDAVEILDEIDDFGDTPEEKVETLGLYGAIYKRKWEVDGQRLNLERSLLYYRLGHDLDTDGQIKQGYGSINAAYLLELLAYQEASEKLDDERLAALVASVAPAASTSAAPAAKASPAPSAEGGNGAPTAGDGARATGGIAETDAHHAPADIAAVRRAEADEIRRRIVGTVPKLVSDPPGDYDWWKIVTVAEAYFGLRQYDEAGVWLMKGADLHERLVAERDKNKKPVPDWEWESTLRQLASLARLQAGASADNVDPKARRVLGEFIERRFGAGNNADAALRSAFMGKVGLGLSGGGFRASLFHIGVLAKMAELDLLRRVEVLSCVSGGSIVGAHYYLELRELLQRKPDPETTREDYVDIVQRLERDFLAGVQRNIRSRVIAGWWTNIKLVVSRTYTRTNRVGELYESELFARVRDGGATDARGRRKRRLISELGISPAGTDNSFSLKHDNWRRAAKVPILVLNATTLNTGHNWQFTASWMGEPPARSAAGIDASERLRRMYYWQAPSRHREVSLGDAVAASACVPGLFEPLIFKDLYPDRTVRLVDGGVQDNQGITALLEQDCNVLLVSDASGQMASVKDVGEGFMGKVLVKALGTLVGGVVSVLLRTKDVLMARVREAQHDDLGERRRSSQLRGLMFIHLTRGLNVQPIPWLTCDDPLPANPTNLYTGHGVLKEVQRLLATVRTDLDSFTDAEAYALMAGGYMMAHEALEVEKVIELGEESAAPRPKPNWRFLAVKETLMNADDRPGSAYQSLVKQLKVSGGVAFKVWRLNRWLQGFAGALALVLLAAAVYGVYWVLATPEASDAPIMTYGGVVRALLKMLFMLLLTLVLGKTVMTLAQYKKTLTRALIHLGMCVFGFLVARLHVHFFDKLYLSIGRVPFNPHVFLCYSHEDEQYVSALDEALRDSGCRTALDGKDTLYSEARKGEIEKLLGGSDTVLYVGSEGEAVPDACRKWLEPAARKGKPVVRRQPRRAPFRFRLPRDPVAPGTKLDAEKLEQLLREIEPEPAPIVAAGAGAADVSTV